MKHVWILHNSHRWSTGLMKNTGAIAARSRACSNGWKASPATSSSRRVAFRSLEGQLAGTQAQLTKFTQLEAAIQNAKLEIAALVERGDEDRVQAQRELERARLGDREMLSREIGEVRRELPRIGRVEEAIDIRARGG